MITRKCMLRRRFILFITQTVIWFLHIDQTWRIIIFRQYVINWQCRQVYFQKENWNPKERLPFKLLIMLISCPTAPWGHVWPHLVVYPLSLSTEKLLLSSHSSWRSPIRSAVTSQHLTLRWGSNISYRSCHRVHHRGATTSKYLIKFVLWCLYLADGKVNIV